MSLEDELEAQRRRAYEQRSPQERKARADAVTAVADAKVADRALNVGDRMPVFRLPAISGETVDAGRLLDRGPLVISFYRGGPNANPAPAARATSSEQITAEVLAAVAGARDARAGEILAAVIRHAHDLAREVRLTPTELLAAADFLKRCGDISDAARHEYVLLADVLGLTMVVDTVAAGSPDGALETSVLGPFYRAGAPWEPNGANISRGADDGDPAHIHGRVLDTSGAPVDGAVLDVWGTNRNGLYENVDPSQPDYNLRGRFRSGADGDYDLWTAKPVSYPIPSDGPVGELLAVTDRHDMRPAHFHVIASADGHRTIVTELFTDDDPHLHSDAVFGVKPSLVVHYDRIDTPAALKAAGRTEPYWDLEYDFILTPGQATSVGFSTGRQQPA